MDTYQIQPPDIVQITINPNTRAAIICVVLALIFALALAFINLSK